MVTVHLKRGDCCRDRYRRNRRTRLFPLENLIIMVTRLWVYKTAALPSELCRPGDSSEGDRSSFRACSRPLPHLMICRCEGRRAFAVSWSLASPPFDCIGFGTVAFAIEAMGSLAIANAKP